MSEATFQPANLAEQATTKKPRGRPRVANAHQNKLEYMKAYNRTHRDQCNESRSKYISKCALSYKILKQIYEDETFVKLMQTKADIWDDFHTLFTGGDD